MGQDKSSKKDKKAVKAPAAQPKVKGHLRKPNQYLHCLSANERRLKTVALCQRMTDLKIARKAAVRRSLGRPVEFVSGSSYF